MDIGKKAKTRQEKVRGALLAAGVIETRGLISLADWDAQQQNKHLRLTGIACPECGAELADIEDHPLPGYPPRMRVKCTKCRWEGKRIS
jgi:hypothetical protein